MQPRAVTGSWELLGVSLEMRKLLAVIQCQCVGAMLQWENEWTKWIQEESYKNNITLTIVKWLLASLSKPKKDLCIFLKE